MNSTGKHRIGIMQGRICPDQPDKLQVFPRNGWEKELERARMIGFDYMELLYDREEAFENPLIDEYRFHYIHDAIYKSRLNIYSICADYFTQVEFPTGWKSGGKDRLIHLIKAATALRARMIILPFFDKNEVKKHLHLKEFLKQQKKIIQEAERQNVVLCLETTLAAEDMLDAIYDISSAVGVCYDLGNAAALGFDTVNEIRTLKDVIRLVHVKDRMKNNGPNVIIGKGKVDFMRSFQALRDISYRGNFTLETSPGKHPEKNAEFHLKKTKEFLHRRS